jgi:hypothetical protein
MIIIKKRAIFNVIVILVAILAIGFGVFSYLKINKIKIPDDTTSIKEEEVAALISRVERLYLFPKNEVPTIATVSDPKLLKDQTFFTLSQTGDKVLIFLKSGKAVLYRPSIDKIIEISPVKNNSNTPISQ